MKGRAKRDGERIETIGRETVIIKRESGREGGSTVSKIRFSTALSSSQLAV